MSWPQWQNLNSRFVPVWRGYRSHIGILNQGAPARDRVRCLALKKESWAYGQPQTQAEEKTPDGGEKRSLEVKQLF
jgi:hypothetical protein